MNISKWPRGSEWRKWDLHVHTPSSYDYKDMSVTNEEIVKELISNDIALVAITDHFLIDIARITNLRKIAKDKLTILPGIEFRSELGGSQSLHYIGIFPELEEDDLNDLWNKLQGKLNISKKDIETAGGIEAIYKELKQTAEIIHEMGGVVTVHAGTKSNSIEKIPNDEKFKRMLKTDLIKHYIDFLEIGKVEDLESYRAIVFKSIKKMRPIVMCSDNHNIHKYSTKTPCWVKADPNFRGLKQLIYEPIDRIYLGNTPLKISHVSENPTKYIDSILIEKTDDSNLEDSWFDYKKISNNVGTSATKLNFGNSLIAIIGNKGSGKSALCDIIALLGNYKKSEFFSFLTKERFLDPKNRLASKFQGEIAWVDGTTSEKVRLDSNVSQEKVSTVKYIPQNFLEILCNSQNEKNLLENELNEIVFSYLPDDEKLSMSSIQELISFRTRERDERISELRGNLEILNTEIISYEKCISDEYKKKILNLLLKKVEEYKAHLTKKPKKVSPPKKEKNHDPIIEKARNKLKELECIISEKKNKLKEKKEQKELAKKVFQKIKNMKATTNKYIEDIGKLIAPFGFQTEDIVKITFNEEIIFNLSKSLTNEIENLESTLNKNKQGSYVWKEVKIRIALQKKIDEIEGPSKKYQNYLTNLNEWENLKKRILGDSSTTDTIIFYANEYRKIMDKSNKIQSLYDNRNGISLNIYKELVEILKIYQEIYSPLQNFLNSNPNIIKKFPLSFGTRLIFTNFIEKVMEFLDRRYQNNFSKHFDEDTIDDLIKKYTLESCENLTLFLNELQKLLYDKNQNLVNVENKLKKGKKLNEFYNFIFGLEYLKPEYNLNLDSKPLEKLSAGEKGTLLLILYLLVDNRDIPLIIDQPEDNLDNQTIYECLVECIKKAKNKRQIIIVTHNPNLAVVCDAEQVIFSSIDKVNSNKISYVTGSIESTIMNNHIINVLEGTLPAFDNRESKYKQLL